LNTDEDLPRLVFDDIDIAQQIRRETHYLALWQNNGLTHDEFRISIGKGADKEKADKYWLDLELELVDAEAKIQTREAKVLGVEQTKQQEKLIEAQGGLLEKQGKLAEKQIAISERETGVNEKNANTQIKLEREKRETLKVRQKMAARKKTTASQTQGSANGATRKS